MMMDKVVPRFLQQKHSSRAFVMINLAYWFQVSSDSNLPQTMERLVVYLTFWTRVRKL